MHLVLIFLGVEVDIRSQPDSPSKLNVILVDTPVICGSEDNLKEIDGSSPSTSDMVKKPSASDETVSKMTKEKDNTKRVFISVNPEGFSRIIPELHDSEADFP